MQYINEHSEAEQMKEDFKKFAETIKTGLERGEIKVSEELTTLMTIPAT